MLTFVHAAIQALQTAQRVYPQALPLTSNVDLAEQTNGKKGPPQKCKSGKMKYLQCTCSEIPQSRDATERR